MPTQQVIEEIYWSVCWKWIFPYPCRKTRTVTKWAYEFSYLQISERIFYDNYRGCEFNILYKWRDWHWWPGQYNDWLFYFVTKYYSDKKEGSGPCDNTNSGSVGGVLERSQLAYFIDKRIKDANKSVDQIKK